MKTSVLLHVLHSFMPFLVELHDRPDFDGARARRRNPRRDLDGFVQVVGVDQVVAAQLFLGFREGAVGGRDLALPDADGRRRLGGCRSS